MRIHADSEDVCGLRMSVKFKQCHFLSFYWFKIALPIQDLQYVPTYSKAILPLSYQFTNTEVKIYPRTIATLAVPIFIFFTSPQKKCLSYIIGSTSPMPSLEPHINA